jgi:amino acid transporter
MSKPASSKKSQHVQLGQLPATAIAGNDILSSCLYVCGIGSLFAGVWAPLVFLVIALVLYFYKHVYTEVVEALPLNGGAYNCLLNATSKPSAAVAGVMTTLSYVATTVISAKTAAEYLHTVIHGFPVLPATAAIIIAFALLTIAGVRDSAKVAIGIFAFHIFILSFFVTLGLLNLANFGPGLLIQNFHLTNELFTTEGALKMLFLAFSASLLGVSGFESSANFVEEQAPGVFRLTLRNMLLGVLIFNPLITLVVQAVLPLEVVWSAKDFVLSEAALVLGGKTLQYLVVADAFLVLSGAVLASFVGATGLLYRMTLDHCLPTSVFLPKLRRRNQNSIRIVIAFALLCLSILFVTGGELLSLAGVYTISFLGVMTFFAIGNLILRQSRPDLRRTYQGPVIFVILAALSTAAGILGNILIDSRNLLYFAYYFVPALLLVMSMIYRDYILEFLLKTSRRSSWFYQMILPWLEHVIRPRIILFAHHPEKLYDSLAYIQKNETSRRVTIVYCQKGSHGATHAIETFQNYLKVFKEAQIFKKMNFDFVIEREMDFGPDTVKAYAQRYRIGTNFVFIGSVHEEHSFTFEELGGVRVIQ